ncbi:50S ribosomal protein L11 methyltransferase [Frigidibacter sp. ROC022]|uniref:50S ribosomal protein L11 methyltransferase n=1 Tax=Frigidibacter sp. ROC022 TaxID=2971796 RepID=UPI00215B0DDB|nr:50S ribosomal protein L11 methyltransferase [Frigidibacter sp. ROC022]MCR8725129.1 50S ribosomal protein L11 methyltransferase [Frigidibacter sp. ROC022]
MTTYSAFTSLAPQSRAEALGEALEALDPAPEAIGVIEVEDGSGDWEVAAYFTEPPDRAGLALLATVHGAADFVVSELPETDWVAHVRRELKPVEAGRFYVYGSHDADKVPEGRIALLIEAAMAFGTGHHGTTLGCLRALDGLADEGLQPARVADVGCGTAVLAMAAARLWPGAEVLASDIDAQAVAVAEANLAANGLTGRVACVEAAGFGHPDLAAGGFDLIFANILKGPLIELAPALARANRVGAAGGKQGGGVAILSGLLTSQADEVRDHYLAQGYSRCDRADIGDWTTLILRATP